MKEAASSVEYCPPLPLRKIFISEHRGLEKGAGGSGLDRNLAGQLQGVGIGKERQTWIPFTWQITAGDCDRPWQGLGGPAAIRYRKLLVAADHIGNANTTEYPLLLRLRLNYTGVFGKFIRKRMRCQLRRFSHIYANHIGVTDFQNSPYKENNHGKEEAAGEHSFNQYAPSQAAPSQTQ